MIGIIDKKKTAHSSYQPSREIADFTANVKKDYNLGYDIINRPWLELNDKSIIEDENHGQMLFNAFVDTSEEDVNEAWKWKGTRSKARNKGIALHAQLTANYLYPLFLAQNEEDEVDEGMSELMRDMVEWLAQPTVSNYQSSFLQVVFGMLTNPVTYMEAKYQEVMQKIKTKQEDGSYKEEEIIDEVLSGFQCPLWSASQVLITNAYERNIQKQRAIIKRRYVEYDELEPRWEDHENWGFVTPLRGFANFSSCSCMLNPALSGR